MQCAECDYAIDDSAKFCKGCGSALVQSDENYANHYSESVKPFWKSKWSVIAVAAVTLGCGGACWLYTAQPTAVFVPMEAKWKVFKGTGEWTSARYRCRLTNINGLTIPIHSDNLVGFPIRDSKNSGPGFVSSSPASKSLTVGGRLYSQGSFEPRNFTESLGDWIGADRLMGSNAVGTVIDGVKGTTILPFPPEANVVFIDSTGEVKIMPIPHSVRATAFSTHGVAGVLFRNDNNSEEKWGIIDRSGASIIPPRFSNFVMLNSNVAFAEEGGRWAKIDVTSLATNPAAYSFTFDYEGIVPSANSKLIPVKSSGAWSILDANGKELIAPTYEGAFPGFSKSHFSAQVGGKWGVYGLKGEIIFAPNFDVPPLLFPDGSAAFALTTVGENVNWVDRQGKILRSEKLRIDAVYSSPSPIIIAREEVARPLSDPDVAEISTEFHYVIIDDKGRALAKPLSNKWADGGSHFTGQCIRQPVGNFGN